MTDRDSLVRHVPLLARLSEADRRALASRGRIHSYRDGAPLFSEGDPGDALHIIIEGRVRVMFASRSGGEVEVALLGPGECVGDLALFDDRPRSATAIASQPTRTLVVTRDAFLRWLSERPKAALALLQTLSLRLRRTDEALADFAFADVPTRLAKRLLDLEIEQHELALRDPTDGRIRITQGELASMLGVSRESVNKQLNAFAREGWIALSRGLIAIRDANALRALL
ncbi:MAG: Crp/Fnr family transcriptional regulator [Dehalococcoidia bacterium]